MDAVPHPIKRVLVANRGEIACRVIAAARAKGIETVAVHSDADRDARHVALADRAIGIGPAPAAQSYLSIPALIAAAIAAGADAVHPGYGFLSENADFAQSCLDAGLIFIGPTPEAIRAMGDKAAAKRRMIAAGVPCLPGYEGTDQDDATLIAAAGAIGFPLMVKAAAGGGGRGLRLVTRAEALPEALAAARSEARSAFGSDVLILERALARARHVEVQILADHHGAVIHLGERDCSLQRRHQKVVEEAPAPGVDPALRAAMGEAALRAARSVAYRGAGTVEFLLEADGRFHFLEMNTRIQVEHPVTEMVTGLDLVGLQFDIAMGRPLPLAQSDVDLSGHAIEARICAEDPANGFLPRTGRVLAWAPATGPGIRVDHGLAEGREIGGHYDSLLAKVIAHGPTRAEALGRLIGALRGTRLFGVTTNKGFLVDLLRDPEVMAGAMTTATIAERGAPAVDASSARLAAALAAALLVARDAASHGELGLWWSAGAAETLITLEGTGGPARLIVRSQGTRHRVGDADGVLDLDLVSGVCDPCRFVLGGVARQAAWHQAGDRIAIDLDGHVHDFADVTHRAAEPAQAGADGLARAPMNGRVVAVAAAVGARVARGETLVILEAMKMEHRIIAPRDGIIASVSARVGDQVATRQILAALAPEDAA